MEYKTFATLDRDFIWTVLENHEFDGWHGKNESDEFDKIKLDALILSEKYSKAHSSLELYYPAYYVKGKNWPYYNSICMVTSLTPYASYGYYEWVYVSVRTNGFTIFDNWEEVSKDGYCYTNIIENLSKEERKFLWV